MAHPPQTQVDLPPGYYLDNFLMLLNFVDASYSSLLISSEKLFSKIFKQFSNDAQRLYVRLVCRRGPIFRSDKLNYSEIKSITLAAEELAEQGFLSIGLELNDYDQGDIEELIEELLGIVTKPELNQWFSHCFDGPAKFRLYRKMEIVDMVLQQCRPEQIEYITADKFDVYKPLMLDELYVYRLLFFGNLRQDFSEFVITDLGHLTYESYNLSGTYRLFRNRRILNQLLKLYELTDWYYWALSLEDEKRFLVESRFIVETLKTIALKSKTDVLLLRRRDRILNGIAREYERMNRLKSAIKIYELSMTPPARERRARIYKRLKYYPACLRQCNEIKSNQPSEDELDFLQRFLPPIEKKMGKPVSYTGDYDIPTETISLPRSNKEKVEQQVLSYYRTLGGAGCFCENQFILGLFGIAFWDIIFLPVQGVFFNPFQRGPADVFTLDFYTQRREKIEKRLSYISAAPNWPEEMLTRFDEKIGIANYFTNWKLFTKDILENALMCIPRPHLTSLFGVIVRDVSTFRSGFPDLVLFKPEEHFYQLVEVKGPGDQVQVSQRRWFKHFEKLGIPYKVTRVVWAS